MGFFRDEDTTGDEHNQSPELMIPQGKMKRAVDELIEHKSGASAGQGEADDSIVISFPDHLSPSLLRQVQGKLLSSPVEGEEAWSFFGLAFLNQN